MQAWAGKEECVPMRSFLLDNKVPGFIGSDIIRGRTSPLAVLAANAFIQVDYHAPVIAAAGGFMPRLDDFFLCLFLLQGRKW